MTENTNAKMSMFFVLILYYLRVIVCEDISPDLIEAYCKLKCDTKGDIHTVCKYKCEISPDCVNYVDYPMSDRDRQYVLDAHNFYRNKLAAGRDKRGGNGKAKNMIALNYDKDIEVPTMCWVRRCIFDHDTCRQSLKHSDAGQNLVVAGFDGRPDNKWKFRGHLNVSVTTWYEEIKDCTEAFIKRFATSKIMIGHFTQVIWARSKFIGCSKITYTLKDSHRIYVACNYSPAGNVLGMPVYEYGSGCSGDLKPNAEYPALCGETTIISKEREPSFASVGRIILDRLLLVVPFVMYCTV